MDVVGSGLALLVLSPLYLAIYIAIKFDTKGPAIYPALRGGYGKDFWFYKFRSMYANLSPGLGGEEAEQFRQQLWEKNDRGGKDAPFLKVKDDPRVTRVGRILRKTKLDELPQFWNVLKGDMSLVGPRAHVLDEVERYRNQYRRMFSIKPGIFGVSQIAQMSWPDLPFDEEIRLNTYYIENWSLWLDIKTLFKSAYLIAFGAKPTEDY
jgi:lipopolysaccharide/colanic/teichoic acid biosynthesis glycosyltransferase